MAENRSQLFTFSFFLKIFENFSKISIFFLSKIEICFFLQFVHLVRARANFENHSVGTEPSSLNGYPTDSQTRTRTRTVRGDGQSSRSQKKTTLNPQASPARKGRGGRGALLDLRPICGHTGATRCRTGTSSQEKTAFSRIHVAKEVRGLPPSVVFLVDRTHRLRISPRIPPRTARPDFS